jgi:hypothetical protein
MLNRLRQLGVFAPSAGSLVEASVVPRLAESFRRSPSTSKPDASDRAAHKPPTQSKLQLTAEEQALARALGVSPHQLEARPARQARQATRKSQREAAHGRPLDDWLRALISDDEKAEWIAAGLGEHDARLAEQCQREGLTPEDLRLRVSGRFAGERIRGGESVVSVAAMVREHKARTRDVG